jgi:unsaturated rhamnogalacturonyl hydrolase
MSIKNRFISSHSSPSLLHLKRRDFLVGALTTACAVTTGMATARTAVASSSQLQPPPRQNVLSAMRKVNDYWINQQTSPGTNNWVYATYYSGDLAAYATTGDQRYLNYALAWAQQNNYGLSGGNTTRNANAQASGQVYLSLYQISKDPSSIAQITTDIQRMVNSPRSNDWWWIDALNMAMPCFAQLGALYQDNTYYAKMYALYNYTKSIDGGRGLYDTNTHLWFRDSSFLPPYTSPEGKNVYWSRGNGWVFAAHAKVLAVLPTSEAHYQEYVNTFKNMAAALRSVQRSDGFWNVDLEDPQDFPGPETSGTAFFVYGMAWGLNQGILDRATYLPVVTRAWNALVTTAIQPDGSLGYVQATADSPSSGQPVTAQSTAAYGVGAFLLAGQQVAMLA